MKRLRPRALVLPLLVLFVNTAAQTPQSQDPQIKALAFTHVAVIDVTGSRIRTDMTVVVSGGRIAAVDVPAAVPIPQGAQVVDASGKFMIPGLWDMHVHSLGFEKEDYLSLFVANGVTGVRIMWGVPEHHQWRKEIEAGALLGPRLVIASPLIDGPNPIWPGSISVRNEIEAREAVRESKRAGADFIKVYSLLPRDAFFAIADEARKQGLPFSGHVPNSVSLAEASDAGQRSFEHLLLLFVASSTLEEEWRVGYDAGPGRGQPVPATFPTTRMILDAFSREKAEALSRRLKENRTWQTPTLTVLRPLNVVDREDPRLKYIPPAIRNRWSATRGPRDEDLATAVYKKNLELVGMLRQGGVELLAGTDVGNPYCMPGFSLHDELALLVQAGLTPMEALKSATLNAARFQGREADLGAIAPGQIADLVLLDANPLDDIGNTKRINAVVVNGRLLERSALDRLLSQVENRVRTP